jgi:hypothetical protein
MMRRFSHTMLLQHVPGLLCYSCKHDLSKGMNADQAFHT